MKAPSNRGSVLIIVLWMLTVMSIICLSFAKMVRVEANAVLNTRLLSSAYYLAQAGINETIYKLIVFRLEGGAVPLALQETMEPSDIEKGRVELKTDIGDVRVDLSDEDGKINVNRASKELLLSLLLNMGTDEERADVISDSILDWVDADDDYHLNGAESDYYTSLDNPYRAKNGRMDTVEELLLVRGMDADLFYGRSVRDLLGKSSFIPGLNRCLTVYGTSAGINVNSAPYYVLLAIGFSPDVARQVMAERSRKPFKDDRDFTQRIPGAPGMQELKTPVMTRSPLQSAYFSMVSTASMHNSRLKKTIFTVIRLNARFPLKHSIVYWNENYYLQENENFLSQE